MDGIENIGALLGSAAAGFLVVFVPAVAALLKWLSSAGAAQSKRTVEDVRLMMAGTKDDTPKDVESQTGFIRLAMRSELEPLKSEQRRHGQALDRQGQVLRDQKQLMRLILEDNATLHGRDHEISGRVGQVEGHIEDSKTGRITLHG